MKKKYLIDEMPKKYAQEMVLVCERSRLEKILGQGGLIKPNDEILSSLSSANPMLRINAENDLTVIQLVAYYIIINNGEILTHKRTKRQPEKRLVNIRSLGFSGHINTNDQLVLKTLEIFEESQNYPYITRELAEEVKINLSSNNPITFEGLLWDPSDDIGIQHLALIYYVYTDKEYEILEPGLITDARFEAVHDIKNNIDEYTTWSKIILSNTAFFEKKIYV